MMEALSADVAELFHAFSGYPQYESALERWGAFFRSRDTTYHRERYQNDPEWREQRRAYINAWRHRNGVMPKEQYLALVRKPREHGTYREYHKYGCRCTACRAASAKYRREMRARAAARRSA